MNRESAAQVSRRGTFLPTRADWLEAALVALSLFALYAATAPRTVALEDDGLFILSSYFLGIEHPPGYPLHTLLGKAFTLLPIGSIAYRVHLLSAVFGALTCAAVWLCARALIEGRIPAYVAAFGLGVSRTFWSQAIIAEVYTFNTLFLFVLLLLGLRACPAGRPEFVRGPGEHPRLLPLIAFIFGLSLANHWPLMLLAAPGLAVLLWPLARGALRRAHVLLSLFVLGLTPYAWMVFLSWGGLVISFNGPIESVREFWFFVSRAGYAHVDGSPSATWIDRIRYFEFLGSELLAQFALVGTIVAAVGFTVQWQVWGRRVSWGLTVAFLGPSAVLLLLLGFDYDSLHKHMFHVYPLPAYGIAALWMGLGFSWLAQRYARRAAQASAACAALLALILAVGVRQNLLARYDWAVRYADAVLRSVPQNAIVLVRGDPDLAPIGYRHMVEGQRPDITLYQPQGLILGNRLFHPLRTSPEQAAKRVAELVSQETGPVVLTQWNVWNVNGHARRDRWLFSVLDRTSSDSEGYTIDVPEDMVRFFEESVLSEPEVNAWAAVVQGELRRQYGRLLAETLPRDRAPAPGTERHLAALSKNFFGALGVVEGLLANKQGYSVPQAVRFMDEARTLMPSDASKQVKARYFELRAYLRLAQKDELGAIQDLETAVSLWPVKSNGAVTPLGDLYAKAGRQDAKEVMLARLKP
jgi:hypothetical protein